MDKYESYVREKIKESQYNTPIDKVTTQFLDMALRMCNIQINYVILDKIIDLVELIEIKGDQTSFKDICNLQKEWENFNNPLEAEIIPDDKK